MTFLNGYTKSLETYQTNNRVKSYLVEVYTKVGEEVQVTKFSKATNPELKDRDYKVISGQNYFQMLDIIVDGGDPTILSDDMNELLNEIGMTTKIRLTIKDVFKGTKYNDTCISELLFYGLKK